MSTTKKVEQFIRRQLAASAELRKLRVLHVAGGRGGGALEDVPIPAVRGDSTALELAEQVEDIARAHAAAYQGRQTYQLDAYAADADPVGSTSLSVYVEPTGIDATTEATDARSFGAMAARHLEVMQRQYSASIATMLETLTRDNERLSRELERERGRTEVLMDGHRAVIDKTAELRLQEIELKAQAAEDQGSDELRQMVFGLIAHAGPQLLEGVQKYLAAPAKRKKRRRKAQLARKKPRKPQLAAKAVA